MSNKNPWKTKSSKEIYNNAWIKVVENQVVNPAGNNGIYGVVHFKNIAVGIVPIDKNGYTYLVGQYRYTHNTYEWEIPMGGGLKNVDVLKSAKRELLEETGLKAKKWEIILESQVSNSVTDEISITFLATDLTQHAPIPEETEELSIKKLHINEAVEMALNGKIRDLISIASLLKVDYLLKNNLLLY